MAAREQEKRDDEAGRGSHFCIRVDGFWLFSPPPPPLLPPPAPPPPPPTTIASH